MCIGCDFIFLLDETMQYYFDECFVPVKLGESILMLNNSVHWKMLSDNDSNKLFDSIVMSDYN